MRTAAESHIGEEITQAVITVPAYFNDAQRQATKAAAEQSGLTVLRIINEPTAAALAYGLGKSHRETIAVFDLGGGTFDVSLLDIDHDVFEVRATGGDNSLGGDNFDAALSEMFAAAILEETGVDPHGDMQALQRIRDAAEKIKCELSTLQETTLNLPFIVADESGPKHFSRTVTRAEFEELLAPLIQRVTEPCKQALSDAQLQPADISTVLLVGGSTRIPLIQRVAAEIFGREPNRSINPDEVVAAGAAIQASIISGDIQEVLLLDVTPLSLGIELEGGMMKALIPRNSSIPTTASRCFTTSRDGQRAVVIHVLQGERAIAKENRSLAKFRLSGIAPAPKEVPEIEVSFHIDANGILSVSAEDLTSSQRAEITVEATATISADEIERMVSDARAHQDEDLEFARRMQEHDRAIGVRDQFEEFLIIHGADLDKQELAEMQEALEALRSSLEANDAIGIEQAKEVVSEFMQVHSDLFYLHALSHQKSEESMPDTDPEEPLLEADLEPGSESEEVASRPDEATNA
jgi:molecular chaperone DnaK